MKVVKINGNKTLSGTIKISGSKNSVVALIPASILTEETVRIESVPNISDTNNLIDILKFLGSEISYDNEILNIKNTSIVNKTIPEELAKKLRASYYFMGALLARFKKVQMYFPGGCNIGSRPIDLHLKGFKKMGAKITCDNDLYIIEAEELIGSNIYLDFASVGATINLMLAATLAKGITTIENAAEEPEIVNIALLLNNMGAKIIGAGTNKIRIIGVEKLHSGIVEVIPDRIEAGTYLIAGALLGDNLKIENIIPKHIDSLLSKFNEIGIKYECNNNSITICKQSSMLPTKIKTQVYPGFPTDLAQPMTVLFTKCNGNSLIEETIYENRMGHIPFLNKMGAKIKATTQTATVMGPCEFHGEMVTSTDLRAGASLLIAGLLAKGKTTILDAEHILRGYENIEDKLKSVGADIVVSEIE